MRRILKACVLLVRPKGAMAVLRYIDRNSTNFLISAMIVLVLLGFARILTVTDDLRTTQGQLLDTQGQLLDTQAQIVTAQAKACKLRRAGRSDTNAHERVPLRAAFNYLGGIGVAGAAKQTDPAQKAATLAFGNRFKRYARLIEPLPNPNC